MKTILCLTLICAATAQAQYTSAWSEFDAGTSASQAAATTHRGAFTRWLRHPMQSASYAMQQGNPPTPMVPPPTTVPILTISRVGSDVRISWPASAAGFVLEATQDLTVGSSWSGVPGPYQSNSTERFIVAPASQSGQFYRLVSSR
jgi:hypothetical protein